MKITTKIKQATINSAELTNKIIFYDSPLPRNEELTEYLVRNGISVRYFNDPDLVSFIRYDIPHRQPVIAVNARMSTNLRNVAIAHELAYLVLEYHWLPFQLNRDFCASKHTLHFSKTVIDQNDVIQLFMQHFLIPDTQLLEDIVTDANTNDYHRIISLITKMFDVPQSFAATRLKDFLSTHTNAETISNKKV